MTATLTRPDHPRSASTTCSIRRCWPIPTRFTAGCATRPRCTGTRTCTPGSSRATPTWSRCFSLLRATRTPTPEQLARDGPGGADPDRGVMVRADAVPRSARAHGAHAGARLGGVHPPPDRGSARRTSGEIAEACSTRSRRRAHGRHRRDLAYPLPAIVTAEMLGRARRRSRPAEALVGGLRRDAGQLPAQPRTRPARARERRGDVRLLPRAAIRDQRDHPTDGLITR